jgi:hypothetical protein
LLGWFNGEVFKRNPRKQLDEKNPPGPSYLIERSTALKIILKSGGSGDGSSWNSCLGQSGQDRWSSWQVESGLYRWRHLYWQHHDWESW